MAGHGGGGEGVWGGVARGVVGVWRGCGGGVVGGGDGVWRVWWRVWWGCGGAVVGVGEGLRKSQHTLQGNVSDRYSANWAAH